MICPVCGNAQDTGDECFSCKTPLNTSVGSKSGTSSAIDLMDKLDAANKASALDAAAPQAQSAPPSPAPASTATADPAKSLVEEEKLLSATLQKMEEEKQRLLEMKSQREKQIQEIKSQEIQQEADRFKNIVVTPLQMVSNKPILEHKGMICSQVIIKKEGFQGVISGLKDAAGIRNTTYFENLKKGYSIGFSDLKIEAFKLKANAVVGVTVTQHFLPGDTGAIILSFTGDAVVIS